MNQILTEKDYKKLFKSEKRYSALLSTITSIVESPERTGRLKLELITAILQIAAESICSVSGCEQLPFSKGLCNKHYIQQKKQSLPPKKPYKTPRKYPEICSVPGCERKHSTKGYCSLHYSRVFNSGIDPTDLEAMNQPVRRRLMVSSKKSDNNGSEQ